MFDAIDTVIEWCNTYSEYFVVYNGYDVDINRGWDLINRFAVISSTDGFGDRHSIDTMSNIVYVMSYVVQTVPYI